MWKCTKLFYDVGVGQRQGKGEIKVGWRRNKHGKMEIKRTKVQSHFNLLAGSHICLSELCS